MNEIGLRTTADLTRYAISRGLISGSCKSTVTLRNRSDKLHQITQEAVELCRNYCLFGWAWLSASCWRYEVADSAYSTSRNRIAGEARAYGKFSQMAATPSGSASTRHNQKKGL